jgi:hypothetical protein
LYINRDDYKKLDQGETSPIHRMTSSPYHTIRMVATGSLMGREMTPFPDTPHKPDPNSFSSIRNRVMTAETPDKRVELTSGQIHDNLKTCVCDVTCLPAWRDYAPTLCRRSLPPQNAEPQRIVFALEKPDH